MFDAFTLLGLPRSFDLSQDQIERAYLSKAARVHPDTAENIEEAEDLAADLNLAKTTLLNPESRAEHLLLLLGGSSKERDRTLPPGFLEEMMELRETIDQELASGHAPARTKWQDWTEQRRQTHIANIGSLFRPPSPIPPAPLDLKAIRLELNAWRYIERLIEELGEESSPKR